MNNVIFTKHSGSTVHYAVFIAESGQYFNNNSHALDTGTDGTDAHYAVVLTVDTKGLLDKVAVPTQLPAGLYRILIQSEASSPTVALATDALVEQWYRYWDGANLWANLSDSNLAGELGYLASNTPLTCTGQATVVDGQGNPLSGVNVTFTLIKNGSGGMVRDSAPFILTSAGTTVNNLTGQFEQGSTYQAYRGTSTKVLSAITVPVGVSTFSLPEIIGLP